MTFAEFEQLPDRPGKQELVDGELILMPPPENQHSLIAMRILVLLLQSGLAPGRVWADHTGYRIAGGWIEPDVSVSWPDQPRDEKYFVRAPMLAVEIRSPGEDLERKLTLYFVEGAAEVWILDPHHQSMTVYLRHTHGVLRIAVEQRYHCEALGLTISLAEVFA
jgi:Uma2 family endonuclease